MAAVVRPSGGQDEAGAVAASCQLQVEQFPCLSVPSPDGPRTHARVRTPLRTS